MWLACLFGAFGLHRFYVGKTGTGILYLITFGLLGVGQFVDVFRMRTALADRTHERHDKIFGSLIGLTCGAIGVTSAITYNL